MHATEHARLRVFTIGTSAEDIRCPCPSTIHCGFLMSLLKVRLLAALLTGALLQPMAALALHAGQQHFENGCIAVLEDPDIGVEEAVEISNDQRVSLDTQLHMNSEQLIAVVELNVLGKTFPAKDDTARLSQIESAIFSDFYQAYDKEVETRLSRIYFEAPPPDQLVSTIDEKAVEEPKWFKKSATLGWVNSIVQRTSLLELLIYNKISSNNDLFKRIETLEQDGLGKGTKPQGNLNDRVNRLMETLQPSDELIDKVVNASKSKFDWFLNPEQAPLSNPIQKGPSLLPNKFKEMGKQAGSGIGRVLTSPTLWKALIAAGLLYGAFELARRGALPVYDSSYGYPNYPSPGGYGHACIGLSNCQVCSNCSSCGHCNSGGSPCGIYFQHP